MYRFNIGAEKLSFKNSHIIFLSERNLIGAEILIKNYLKAFGFKICRGNWVGKIGTYSRSKRFVIFKIYTEGFEDFNREARFLRKIGIRSKDIMVASLIMKGKYFG